MGVNDVADPGFPGVPTNSPNAVNIPCQVYVDSRDLLYNRSYRIRIEKAVLDLLTTNNPTYIWYGYRQVPGSGFVYNRFTNVVVQPDPVGSLSRLVLHADIVFVVHLGFPNAYYSLSAYECMNDGMLIENRVPCKV
jgi:hypothetical protein